jgi:hypothetical protein
MILIYLEKNSVPEDPFLELVFRIGGSVPDPFWIRSGF